MSWILKVREKFQAAHFLKEYKGKCEKIHGHTFYVEVEIEVQYSVDQVLEEVRKIRQSFPAQWICITGGEPLLQDIDGLTKALKKKGLKIQVETNATLYRTLPVDWYSISPKPDRYTYRPEYREKAKELKIIVTKNLDLESIRRLRKWFPEKIPILLQPQSNRKWSIILGIKLLKQSLKAGLKNMRLSGQLHKIYGIR